MVTHTSLDIKVLVLRRYDFGGTGTGKAGGGNKGLPFGTNGFLSMIQ